MTLIKKILRKIFPILVVLVVLAGVLVITASFGNSSTATSNSAVIAVAAEMKTLLNEGDGDTATGYFEAPSPALVAAAAGDYNSKFYDLGKLLVTDGLGHTIIDLGREMNGTWYEWSEHRAPPSEPDAYILAWRQIVTTMRSVPGQHFKFLWTVYMADLGSRAGLAVLTLTTSEPISSTGTAAVTALTRTLHLGRLITRKNGSKSLPQNPAA